MFTQNKVNVYKEMCLQSHKLYYENRKPSWDMSQKACLDDFFSLAVEKREWGWADIEKETDIQHYWQLSGLGGQTFPLHMSSVEKQKVGETLWA